MREVIDWGGWCAAIPLSEDHKPNRSDERSRIEAAGGVVVWAGTWRVGGVLAVSRAFGDRLLKRYVVRSSLPLLPLSCKLFYRCTLETLASLLLFISLQRPLMWGAARSHPGTRCHFSLESGLLTRESSSYL